MEKKTKKYLSEIEGKYPEPQFSELVDATASVLGPLFRKEIEDFKDETFYTFLLYTWEGVDHIAPDANTEESLEEMWQQTDPSWWAGKSEFRWIWSEWDPARSVADIASEQMIENKLSALREAVGVREIEFLQDAFGINDADDELDRRADLQQAVFDAMASALAKMDDDGIFRAAGPRNQYLLYVTLTDSPLTNPWEKRSAKILNPGKALARRNRDRRVSQALYLPTFVSSLFSIFR